MTIRNNSTLPTSWNTVALWRWNASDEDVCGICRIAFDGCCPDCKVPGDDCPLIWGKCTHCFHMHCLLKWINTENSKGQCPMDRRPWGNAPFPQLLANIWLE
ncbi:anaphase-promoting complex subunit 11 RING-H2 finger-domain-containing protein [Endogone sp. FLAS-F59071]|nr:anaphase-promoting complex subunit 11 RING-H2 finger-domain-containing protein [Endogone sp. FLAS-F59071]|eukprot:RUS19697.1 anaphase-promoting complex subunit 11 RING-H2 finger-domain-containing protein [Endogone sp. FLAS-F59071]